MKGIKIGTAYACNGEYRGFEYVDGMRGATHSISEDNKTLTLTWTEVHWPKPTKKWNPHLCKKN